MRENVFDSRGSKMTKPIAPEDWELEEEDERSR